MKRFLFGLALALIISGIVCIGARLPLTSVNFGLLALVVVMLVRAWR